VSRCSFKGGVELAEGVRVSSNDVLGVTTTSLVVMVSVCGSGEGLGASSDCSDVSPREPWDDPLVAPSFLGFSERWLQSSCAVRNVCHLISHT
jgi:hypothetical protein